MKKQMKTAHGIMRLATRNVNSSACFHPAKMIATLRHNFYMGLGRVTADMSKKANLNGNL